MPSNCTLLNLSQFRWYRSWQRWGRWLLAIALAGILSFINNTPAFAANSALSSAATTPDDIPEAPALPSQNNLGTSAISSEKVNAFVQAYVQVSNLIEGREGELQGAETELESLRIQREIETAAFNTIEDSGLTRQEYLQLLGLANTDPEFGERVATQIQEMMRD